MTKIKRYHFGEDCPHQLCPLGKGAPICSYTLMKENRLATAKLQDFPPCNSKRCPANKSDDVKR